MKRSSHLPFLFMTMFLFAFLSGCSVDQEPVVNNMGVSSHIDRMLLTEDDRVFDKHLTSVVEAGEAGVPWIKEAWKDNPNADSHYRLATAIELIGPGAADMVPLLIEELDEIDEERVSLAAFALGGIGLAAAPAMDKLADLMRASDLSTQVNLLYALGSIGTTAEEHIPMIMEAMERERTRSEAIIALSQMGEAAVSAMMAWVEDGDVGHRLMACQVLAGVNDQTVPLTLDPLSSALRDDDPRVRIEAAKALGAAGSMAIPVYQNLVHALRESDEQVHEEVVQALIRIGPVGGKELINALTDKKWRSRQGAARVIGTFSSLALTAKTNLITGLSDTRVEVRMAVVQALAVLGEEVVGEMIQQLRSSDVYRKSGAARVLAEIGPPARAALPDLQKLLNDPDTLVRAEAQKAIVAITGR